MELNGGLARYLSKRSTAELRTHPKPSLWVFLCSPSGHEHTIQSRLTSTDVLTLSLLSDGIAGVYTYPGQSREVFKV